jgi:rare lipoprotein A
VYRKVTIGVYWMAPLAGHDIRHRVPGSDWPLVGLWQKNHTKMNSRDGHGFGRDQAMVELSLPGRYRWGLENMSSIKCDGPSCVGIGVRRTLPDEPNVSSAGVRAAVRLLAVALTAATLAACAQSSVVTNKSASLAPGRQASPEPVRKASIIAKRAVAAKKHAPLAANKPAAETKEDSHGLASFYWQGSRTANGENFNPGELTAAHRTLPFGTRLRVTNVATGQSVTVRVNDRGPFVPGRVVDVSHSAAETLGIVGQGVAKVKLDVVE